MALDDLTEAIGAAYGDRSLTFVLKLLNKALAKDLGVETGNWVKQSGSIDAALEGAIRLKLQALDGLGFPPIELGPIKATFDPAQRATIYEVDANDTLRFVHGAGITRPTLWTLKLEQIDPAGSSPPGYQSKDPNAPSYASAAFDAKCDNSLLPGATKGPATGQDASYQWTGETLALDNNGITNEENLIWYHGDPVTYPNSLYGCDHAKMGARGHQGTITFEYVTQFWSCIATIEGSNLSATPVLGNKPLCGVRLH